MKKLFLAFAVLVGGMAASQAGGSLSFGFSIPLGSPSYQAPPVYSAPAPVYSAPGPAYPAPPVYYPPPVAYGAPTLYLSYGTGWYGGHGYYGGWGYRGHGYYHGGYHDHGHWHH